MTSIDKRQLFGEEDREQVRVDKADLFPPTGPRDLTDLVQDQVEEPIVEEEVQLEDLPLSVQERVEFLRAQLGKADFDKAPVPVSAMKFPKLRKSARSKLLMSDTTLLGTSPLGGEDISFLEELRARPVPEVTRVAGRGLAGLTGGLSDIAIKAITGKELPKPETIPGTVAGAGLEVAGFLLGPLKLSKAIIGGRVSIQGVTKFRQMANLVVKGSAELGLAGGLASVAPAYMQSESATDMALQIAEGTAVSALIGGLFPISSLIPTKPLRLVVGLAVMDMIRAPENNIFTIDDVVQGVADGFIDKKELAERSFGYILDLYFLSKVPGRRQLLETFKGNKLIAEFLREIEKEPGRIEKDVAFIEEKLDASLFEPVKLVKEKTPVDILLKKKEVKPSPEVKSIEQAVKDTKPIIGIKKVHTDVEGRIVEGPDPAGITTQTIKTHPADAVLKQVGNQIILDRPSSKDIAVFVEWILSPEFALRDHPKAQRLAGKIIDAELVGSHLFSKDLVFFRESKHTINKAAQRKVTEHLRLIMGGEEGLKLSKEEKAAAESVRKWFDSIAEDIKIYKRAMYQRHLPDNESKAFFEVIDGGSVADAMSNNKVSSKVILDLVKEYKSIENWGLKDYITNMERGTYKMLDPDGTTVLIGVTRADAIRKAVTYLKANPTVRTLQLDTSAPKEAGLATELSRGQYFAIRGRLEKALESDISFINKEVAQAAAKEGLKGLLVIKPSFKRAGPLIQRKGVLAGEDNIYDILPAYASSIRKKISLDPVIADVRAQIGEFPTNIRNLLLSQMDYTKGRHAFGDKAVDHLLGKLGMKPMLWTRSVQQARKAEANLKLGLRPVAAFVNLGGGQLHTYVKTGFRNLVAAHKFIRTEEGKKFIEEEMAYLGMDFAIDTGGSIHTKLKWYNPLFLFQMPETVNRQTSLVANYFMAKKDMGMNDVSAREFARQALRFQQFVYNVAALPRMLRSPGGKLVGQFKTYFVKELEFISTLRGIEILRYTGAFLAMAGPRGVVYMLRSLPFMMAFVGLDKLEEAMNEVIPRLSRGVAGLAETDITAPAVIQLPNQPEDWAGPFLSDAIGLMKEVVGPAMSGEDFITDNALDWAKNLAPISFYWGQLMSSVSDPDGWIRDKDGRPIYQISNWYDKALLTSGAPPIELSRQNAMLKIIANEEDRKSKNQRKAVRRFVKGLTARDEELNDENIDNLIRYDVSTGMLEAAFKATKLTPQQRALLRARKPQKLRVYDLLNP